MERIRNYLIYAVASVATMAAGAGAAKYELSGPTRTETSTVQGWLNVSKGSGDIILDKEGPDREGNPDHVIRGSLSGIEIGDEVTVKTRVGRLTGMEYKFMDSD
jgi:hypothetical protein